MYYSFSNFTPAIQQKLIRPFFLRGTFQKVEPFKCFLIFSQLFS